MNYYELNNFISVNAQDLVSAFKNGETITTGSISVFEDSIGRPGDRIIKLENITEENEKLIFDFSGNEQIIIKNYSHIVINKNAIGIQNCELITWSVGRLGEELKSIELEYRLEAKNLVTKAICGEHFFRVKQNAAALLFYTW